MRKDVKLVFTRPSPVPGERKTVFEEQEGVRKGAKSNVERGGNQRHAYASQDGLFQRNSKQV